MARPKKIFEDRIQTTARIPKWLHKPVKKLCIDLDNMQLLDAINEGLEFWMVYQAGDKGLRLQMSDAAKRLRHKLSIGGERIGSEKTSEKTSPEVPRRRAAG